MKIGDAVKIKKCGPILELVGGSAEIVEMQMQEFEKYRVYPIWVRMTSGKYGGKIYGFLEDEVEILPKADEAQDISDERREEAIKTKVIEQVEEIVKNVTTIEEIAEIERVIGEVIGDAVKIKECDSIPELVGENAEIIEMQMQEFEKYREYPIWAEMTTGERAGKIYGFKYNEVEMLPKAHEAQGISGERRDEPMNKVIKQVEEIVKGVTTVEEIAEVERVIGEAKGKILPELTLGFWEGKTPCWEMFRCPEAMKNECPAFKYRSLPCWQIEGTYCKLYDYGAKGDGTDICQVCRVYKRWGHGEPIDIKLLGKGFDTALKSVSK